MHLVAWVIAVAGLAVLAFPDIAIYVIGGATAWALATLGTPVLWLTSGLLLLCIAVAAGPWGQLRLGGPHDRPEFGTLSWLAMLFAAGMGSGLVFWGVAEPLAHYAGAPLPGPVGARAQLALAITYFHWGLHAWAIYAIAGLVVAWFAYREAAEETPSGALEHGLRGWLGPRSRRSLGFIANAIALAAVVFGVAGALANGTLLLQRGLGLLVTTPLPVAASHALILAAMAVAFMASASSGLRRGIRWLSIANFWLAALLLIIVLLLTDPAQAWRSLAGGVTAYLRWLPQWSLHPLQDGSSTAWAQAWTITYLLWWIAWAPFVGIFIARISRGRSLRAYMLGVLGVPVLFSLLWFAVLGGGALGWDRAHGGSLAAAVATDYTLPLFLWFDALPATAGVVCSWIACVLLFVFLVTSADSAAYVLGMLGHAGDPEPPVRSRLLWGALTVLLAAGLLARASPDVNKSIAIAGAIPYTLLLVLLLIAWLRSVAGLSRDRA